MTSRLLLAVPAPPPFGAACAFVLARVPACRAAQGRPRLGRGIRAVWREKPALGVAYLRRGRNVGMEWAAAGGRRPFVIIPRQRVLTDR